MKTCPSCQAPVQEGGSVCWKCGANLRRSWWRRITDKLAAVSPPRTAGVNHTEAVRGAIAELIGSLEDEDEDVRRNAAAALARIARKDPESVMEAVPKLISLLEDEDGHTRGFAAQALGTVGAEEALEPLRELLGDDEGSGIVKVAGILQGGGEMTVGEVAQEAIERIEKEIGA
jgi:hypothetical protein